MVLYYLDTETGEVLNITDEDHRLLETLSSTSTTNEPER